MSFLDDLAKLAPGIGAALGGPVGGLIGAGVRMAASAITGAEDPAEIVQQLAADPAKLAELEAKVRQLENDELRLHLENMQKARERDVRVRELNGGRNTRGDVLAYGALGLLAVLIGALIFIDPAPGQSRDLLNQAIGAVIAIVLLVYNFEFGSSKQTEQAGGRLAGVADQKSVGQSR